MNARLLAVSGVLLALLFGGCQTTNAVVEVSTNARFARLAQIADEVLLPLGFVRFSNRGLPGEVPERLFYDYNPRFFSNHDLPLQRFRTRGTTTVTCQRDSTRQWVITISPFHTEGSLEMRKHVAELLSERLRAAGFRTRVVLEEAPLGFWLG